MFQRKVCAKPPLAIGDQDARLIANLLCAWVMRWGYMVTGHVDGVGKLRSRRREGQVK